MTQIKVAAGVLNQTPLDWDHNQRNIRCAIDDARARQASILCLPELCITGYGCEDAFHSPHVVRTAAEILAELLPLTQGMIVSLGLPIAFHTGVYNAACLVANGQIMGLAAKQHLAGDGLHYEPRWFKPWPNNLDAIVELPSGNYPLGDLLFEIGGVRIGFEICEDAWVADRPGAELAQEGVDILLNPSASHFAFGKHAIRKNLVMEGCRAFHASYVYANLLGNEAGRAIYDGDAMIASAGRLVASGPRFSYRDFHVTTAIVDVGQTRAQRSRSTSIPIELNATKSRLVEHAFSFPTRPQPCPDRQIDRWELSSDLKEEEFTRTVALGLCDYLRKSRSHGFVVSLSGGADSAAVSTLVASFVHLAVDEIGMSGLRHRMSHIPGFSEVKSPRQAITRLLSCVYQSTKNSSETTHDAARDVASALGARFLLWDVDQVVEDYVDLVSQALDRELTWEADDIALQNIQARARGPGAWLLTNLANALLLATSNRSEAAVGYATMDGDTCGGLSPIAGIDKAFLRHWLRWMESSGPILMNPQDATASPFPIQALMAVNDQQPTAELRPLASKQTDEEDLMPYDILDMIERAAIRDKKSPGQIFLWLSNQRPDQTAEQLYLWIERFFRLWCRNQWKRERYAPSFHLDDESLDPKTWCRFPILSGGYERELRELRNEIGEGRTS